jgi:anti-anti-sigma factor
VLTKCATEKLREFRVKVVEMRIQLKENQGVQEWHISIKGDFDFDVARACLAEMTQRVLENPARVVFDLFEATHLQSCGLGAMLLVAERMPLKKVRPEIRCGDPNIMAVLQVAGMDRQFDLVPVGRLRGLMMFGQPGSLSVKSPL